MIGVGYEVLMVNSVEEVKMVLCDLYECISVVLMDFCMLGGDGIELLCFIDVEYGDIVIIFVIVYVDKDLLI